MSKYESICSACDNVLPDDAERCADHPLSGIYMVQREAPETANVYETGSAHGRLAITIRRKPSEIPYAVDWPLIQLAGTSEMDGPHCRVTYEFLLGEESFLKACAHLDRMGWVKR